LLLAEDGEIIATWDEDRWWTPEASDAFLPRALVVEVPSRHTDRTQECGSHDEVWEEGGAHECCRPLDPRLS
jgi:hypothetical protein